MDIYITIYFVGENQEKASECLPFDSFESAYSYMLDQSDDDLKIFSAEAFVDETCLKEVEL